MSDDESLRRIDAHIARGDEILVEECRAQGAALSRMLNRFGGGGGAAAGA